MSGQESRGSVGEYQAEPPDPKLPPSPQTVLNPGLPRTFLQSGHKFQSNNPLHLCSAFRLKKEKKKANTEQRGPGTG